VRHICELRLEFFSGKFPDAENRDMSFAWVCPYCQHAATIGDNDWDFGNFQFSRGQKQGVITLTTKAIACPNEACKEYTLSVSLRNGGTASAVERTWSLRPDSSAKPLPGYIPQAIVDDYNEACLIRDLSPKASATLSRRRLQGMIRDFWKVTKPTLFQEIEAIKDKIDSDTWEAIDAVRNLGNIGAHMQKDIDVIVDVDPAEAQHLINLIELLIEDWYVTRHDRAQRKKAVVDAAAAKKNPPAVTP